MSGEGRDIVGHREPVEGVVEDADDPVTGDRDRRQGRLNLAGDEHLRSDVYAPYSIVLNPPDGQPVIAGAGVAIAIDVVDVSRGGIHGGMEDSSEESVDRAELGRRLGAVGVGHDDPAPASVERPGRPAVSGAVEHVVDVLRASRTSPDISLEQAVDGA